tara:strand:- start:841 stop:1986 length:1146 start_codon:yes stop_codon:yes gene_type:complete
MAPILTRVGNAFGFGASAGGGGESGGPATVVYSRLDVAGNADPDITNVTIPNADLTTGLGIALFKTGLYTWQWKGSPGTATCWAWGGGGGRQGEGPGPGQGGAGGGVRGDIDFVAGTTWTILVGEGGKGKGSSYPGADYVTGNRAFPDAGYSSYNGMSGGGSSRIATTSIPYGTMNDSPNVYHLIGAGGGGGIGYTDNSGSNDGRGGYPAGQPGGGYYSSDPGCFGRGASQSAGGANGPAGRKPAGTAGGKYSGGPAGTTGGGGGGGGYYGGGGAGGYYATGGGGAGYIHPTVTSTASFPGDPGNRYQAQDDPSNNTAIDFTTPPAHPGPGWGGNAKRANGYVYTFPDPGFGSTPIPDGSGQNRQKAAWSDGNGLVRIKLN